jgi:hypothetical protein
MIIIGEINYTGKVTHFSIFSESFKDIMERTLL